MAGRDGETARLCRTKKLLVDHISGLRALGLGAAEIDVLDREVELVLVALGTAKLGAAIGQHPRQPDGVLVIKRHHPVVEDHGWVALACFLCGAAFATCVSLIFWR